VAVEVETDLGADTLASAYRYVAPPTITFVRGADDFSLTPEGSTSGGARLLIQGNNLAPAGAPAPRVRVDANLAQIESITGTNVIIAIVPPGTEGPADVRVENDFGQDTATDAFRYVAPRLFAADGKGVSGSLWELDPDTGAATEIGPIGYAIDAMAMSPDGVLYAVTWQSPTNAITAKLLVIDTDTGAGSEIADLQVAGTNGQQMRIDDMAFVGTELFGWSLNYARAVKVDTQTGDVDVLATNADIVTGIGEGFAADKNDTAYAQLQSANGALWDVDTVLETWTAGTNLGGVGFTGLSQPGTKSMAFLSGTLHAIVSEHDNGSEIGQNSYLVRINPATGLVSGFIQLSDSIDAIAGSEK